MWIVSTEKVVALGVDGDQYEPIGTLPGGETVFEVPAEVGAAQTRFGGWRDPTDDEDQMLLASGRAGAAPVTTTVTGGATVTLTASPGLTLDALGLLPPVTEDPVTTEATAPGTGEPTEAVTVPADSTVPEIHTEPAPEPEPAPAKKTTRRRASKPAVEGA